MDIEMSENTWTNSPVSQPILSGARVARVLLVALVLRLCWGVLIPVIPLSDSHAYDVFAQNIAHGYGYGWEPDQPSAYWPPGTSAIYAISYWLFGHRYLPIVLLQVLVGVGIVAMGMSLAIRWFGSTIGLATGWILACWPLLIQYTTILASELYFVFFVLLAFWLANLEERKWFGLALAAGVALAAASYVRPIALVMAPLLYWSGARDRRSRVRALLACSVAVVAMCVAVLPWTIRNWHVFHRFVPVSTNGGSNLWMGNNPHSTGGYMELPALAIANEADRDKHLGRLAIRYIAQDPIAFIGRTARKAVHLYDRQSIGVVWNEAGITQRFGAATLLPLKLVSSAYWWIVLAAALIGLYASARRMGLARIVFSPPVLTWLYFTLVYSVTVTGDRYGVSSIPFAAMLAAYALTARTRQPLEAASPSST